MSHQQPMTKMVGDLAPDLRSKMVNDQPVGVPAAMSVAKPAIARRSPVVAHTHVTAPTQFVEANGIRFAYRRLGTEIGTPLVFMQHFRGGLDHWDPPSPMGSRQIGPDTLQ